mmetsp:Transcript_18836/g.41753  ORF Transcript_18836/g.41753 Transcript_18836/m.41753 type:complete len:525 (-) Transcript_18836:362-1936(-)
MQRNKRVVVEWVALHGTVLQRTHSLHELLEFLLGPVMDFLACPPLHAVHLEPVLALVCATMVRAAISTMHTTLAAEASLKLSLLRSWITTSVATVKAVGPFLAPPSFITESIKVRIVGGREARVCAHTPATLTRLVLSLLHAAGSTHGAHPVASNHRPQHSPLNVNRSAGPVHLVANHVHVSHHFAGSSVHTDAVLQLDRNVESRRLCHGLQSTIGLCFVTTLHDHQLRLPDGLLQRHRGQLSGGLRACGRRLSCGRCGGGSNRGSGRCRRRGRSGGRGLRCGRCRRRRRCGRRRCGRRGLGSWGLGGGGCCGGRGLSGGRGRGRRGLRCRCHRRSRRLRGGPGGRRCGGRRGRCRGRGGRRGGLHHHAAYIAAQLLQMQAQQGAFLIIGMQALADLVRCHQLVANHSSLRVRRRRRRGCGRGRCAVRHRGILADPDHVVRHLESVHRRRPSQHYDPLGLHHIPAQGNLRRRIHSDAVSTAALHRSSLRPRVESDLDVLHHQVLQPDCCLVVPPLLTQRGANNS